MEPKVAAAMAHRHRRCWWRPKRCRHCGMAWRCAARITADHALGRGMAPL